MHCVEYKSRNCYLIDERGQEWDIDLNSYNFVQNLFEKNKYSYDKITTRSHGYTTIGDKYKRAGHGHRHTVAWPLTWNTAMPLVSIHTYENRLHTLSSWRNFKPEEVKELGLFEYPKVSNYSTKTILGVNFPLSETYAKFINGRYGSAKKLRLFVLVFDNKDRGIAEEQDIYWKGGNKNEFVIMMSKGTDGMLQWAHVMSPTEVDTLKIEVRDKLTLTPFKVDDDNLLEFMKWLEPQLVAKYIKPDYRQYAYIEVVPSMNAIFGSYIVVLLVNIGVGIFVVKNSWHDRYGPELTTSQAVENVSDAFRQLVYEFAKATRLLNFINWLNVKLGGKKQEVEKLEEESFGPLHPYKTMRRTWPPPPPPIVRGGGLKPSLKRKKRRLS